MKLLWNRMAWRIHWRRHGDLRDQGEWAALTPRAPSKGYRGERAEQFTDRLRALIGRYTAIPETPEWMLPANVDEFLARTRPHD